MDELTDVTFFAAEMLSFSSRLVRTVTNRPRESFFVELKSDGNIERARQDTASAGVNIGAKVIQGQWGYIRREGWFRESLAEISSIDASLGVCTLSLSNERKSAREIVQEGGGGGVIL